MPVLKGWMVRAAQLQVSMEIEAKTSHVQMVPVLMHRLKLLRHTDTDTPDLCIIYTQLDGMDSLWSFQDAWLRSVEV